MPTDRMPQTPPSPPLVPVRFPPGETVLPLRPFRDALFAEVDRRLAAGECPEGRLEIETGESRLTCLVHRSRTFLAGLLERDVYSRVPLADFPSRARQLAEGSASLVRVESPAVMMAAIHFCRRPDLQGSSRLIDPAHVLATLAREEQDAALAFERDGARTLLFLHRGHPARLYFGDPAADPGEGSLEERLLLFAFAPTATEGRVAVFNRLKIEPDPDAGTPLAELAESAKPPPPVDVCAHFADGRELRRRPFTLPEMIIGRDPAVDLFIDNLGVSRKHARLTWERGAFVVEDLGSANGTAVNGEPVERARLERGDKIEIGKFEIRLEEYAAMPSVSETIFMPSLNAPPPGFLVGEGLSLPLDRDVILGSGDGVDARVRGFFVKAVHARVSCADAEFEIVCFGGASVRVNGERTRRRKLVPGDRITLGRGSFELLREPR